MKKSHLKKTLPWNQSWWRCVANRWVNSYQNYNTIQRELNFIYHLLYLCDQKSSYYLNTLFPVSPLYPSMTPTLFLPLLFLSLSLHIPLSLYLYYFSFFLSFSVYLYVNLCLSLFLSLTIFLSLPTPTPSRHLLIILLIS